MYYLFDVRFLVYHSCISEIAEAQVRYLVVCSTFFQIQKSIFLLDSEDFCSFKHCLGRNIFNLYFYPAFHTLLNACATSRKIKEYTFLSSTLRISPVIKSNHGAIFALMISSISFALTFGAVRYTSSFFVIDFSIL